MNWTAPPVRRRTERGRALSACTSPGTGGLRPGQLIVLLATFERLLSVPVLV